MLMLHKYWSFFNTRVIYLKKSNVKVRIFGKEIQTMMLCKAITRISLRNK